MRYTTIIDISEYPGLYKNANVRLVYLHLCLIAGYHDDDRDIADTSIRRLCAQLSMTEAAVRHALQVLERAKLLSRENGLYFVKKWLAPSPMSARPSADQAEKMAEDEQRKAIRRKEEEKENAEREYKASLEAAGKSSFMVYYESKLKKASEGDIDAQRFVEANKEAYENNVNEMRKKKRK